MVFTLTLAAILARPRDLIASLGLATSGASSGKRLRRSLRTRRRVGRGHDPEILDRFDPEICASPLFPLSE